jgi:hypothetical protein
MMQAVGYDHNFEKSPGKADREKWVTEQETPVANSSTAEEVEPVFEKC